MYKLLLLAFLVFNTPVSGQSLFPYEEISLVKPADFRAAEPMALSAADYLLSTPFDANNHDRDRAFQFLVRWSGGDKDYNFRLQGTILDVADDKQLMTLLVPAMTKFCLENKVLGNNPAIIEKNAVKMVLNYCNNPANKFTLKKRARKKLEAV